MVDIGGEKACFYIFASEYQSNTVIDCKRLNFDGTFWTVKDPIVQLYTIDGYLTNDICRWHFLIKRFLLLLPG